MNWNPFKRAKPEESSVSGPADSKPSGGGKKTLTADEAPKFADMAKSLAHEVWEVELDYSVDSLNTLDEIIGELASDGSTSDQYHLQMLTYGCYLGEVIVRNAPGQWLDTAGSNMAGESPYPVVVKLNKGDIVCNPLGKVFKRFEEGDEHHLHAFYQALIAFEFPDEPHGDPGRN